MLILHERNTYFRDVRSRKLSFELHNYNTRQHGAVGTAKLLSSFVSNLCYDLKRFTYFTSDFLTRLEELTGYQL